MTSDRNQFGAYATTSAPVAGLATVRATLSRAQSRWRMNALLRSCILSILVGLASFCALEAAALVSDGETISRLIPRLFPAPTLDHLAKGAVVFAGTLGLTALVAYLRAPGLATHARAADHKFGLKERLSTALEVASAVPLGTPHDPVRSALLTDAEQHARSIDVRALVPFGLPAAAWVLPPLVALAIVLEVTPADTFRNAASSATAARIPPEGGGLNPQQAMDAATNLRHIAEILEQDAMRRSDPYLRTLARTLDRLSAEVAAAKIDRPRLTSELSQLLSHAQQAYAQSDHAANQGLPRQTATELLRSTLNEIAGNRLAAEVPADDKSSVEASSAESKPPARQAQSPERRANNGGTPGEQSAAAAALRRLGVDISWLLVDEDGNEVDPRAQIERLMAEEERRARGGGQPAGAAANAGRGEGDQAGDGVHPFGRGNAKPTDLAATEPMLLPDPVGRPGGHIRIEIPPSTTRSEMAAPMSDASPGWRRMPEQPVDRLELDMEGRRTVGRYFKRSDDGSGANQASPQRRRP